MKSRQHWIAVSLLALLIGLLACGSASSPAPGCNSGVGMGGCNGRSALTGLTVEPAPPGCLTIEADNCNGGVLDVSNQCADPLTLGTRTVAPGDATTFDLRSTSAGFILVETSSNFSEFVPDTDISLSLPASLGRAAYDVSFVKTTYLCE